MNYSPSLWDDAGAAAEAEVAQRALANAKVASAGVWPFLARANDSVEFGQRLDLVADDLSKAAAAGGVDVADLVTTYTREFGILLEARGKEAKATKCRCGHASTHHADGGTCPTCGCSEFVPGKVAASEEAAADNSFLCPCHGEKAWRGKYGPLHEGEGWTEESAWRARSSGTPDYQNAEKSVSDALGGEDASWLLDQQHQGPTKYSSLLASMRTALQEGQDPLEWLEQEGAGQGVPEKPSEAGIEALEGGKAEASARPFDGPVSPKEATWLEDERWRADHRRRQERQQGMDANKAKAQAQGHNVIQTKDHIEGTWDKHVCTTCGLTGDAEKGGGGEYSIPMGRVTDGLTDTKCSGSFPHPALKAQFQQVHDEGWGSARPDFKRGVDGSLKDWATHSYPQIGEANGIKCDRAGCYTHDHENYQHQGDDCYMEGCSKYKSLRDRYPLGGKEAFWGKDKKQAPAIPTPDPLEGRATCPCGARTTAPMGNGSPHHKCYNCDTVFTPKAASKHPF